MEDKENYTKQEVDEMILAGDKYHKKYNIYSSILICGLSQDKDRKERAKEELKESVKTCREKIPKSLLNKIELIDPK